MSYKCPLADMETAHQVPSDVLRRYQRQSINTTLRHLYKPLQTSQSPSTYVQSWTGISNETHLIPPLPLETNQRQNLGLCPNSIPAVLIPTQGCASLPFDQSK